METRGNVSLRVSTTVVVILLSRGNVLMIFVFAFLLRGFIFYDVTVLVLSSSLVCYIKHES